VVAQVLVAALGHNLIHVFERWALPVLGIVFAVACIFIFANGHYDHPASSVPGGWLLAFTAAFGYAVGWNPFAADYSRYLPPTADRRMTGLWAGLGVFIGCVVLELAGAVLVTVTGFDGNGIPTAQLQHAMPDVVYYPTLLCIALGAVAANALNIYSGTMSLVSLGIREMGLTLRQRRAALAIIVGVIGFALGLYFQANVAPGSKYEFFLLLISYWIAPWLAVMFVDYWLRGGDYGDESLFYDTKRFRWQGVVAMAIGLVVSVYLFANVFGVYIGPIPTNNADVGDITFIVGFVITAVLYYVFSMVSGKETMTAAAPVRR
jgi:NCS1 family nucleobase:cation symporter-1